MPVRETVWECIWCGESYTYFHDTLKHEEICDKNPKNEENDAQQTNLLEIWREE